MITVQLRRHDSRRTSAIAPVTAEHASPVAVSPMASSAASTAPATRPVLAMSG